MEVLYSSLTYQTPTSLQALPHGLSLSFSFSFILFFFGDFPSLKVVSEYWISAGTLQRAAVLFYYSRVLDVRFPPSLKSNVNSVMLITCEKSNIPSQYNFLLEFS